MSGFAHVVRHVAARIGADATMLGSDWGGGVRHLEPACGTGTALDRDGLVHIGQTAELWRAVAKLGAPVGTKQVARFLSAWRKVQRVDLSTKGYGGEHPAWPRARSQVAGPSLEMGVLAGVRSTDDGVPNALLGVHARVYKDIAGAALHSPEPAVYLLPVSVEVAFDDTRVPYADARVALGGVRARDKGDRAQAEGLVWWFARSLPFDRALWLNGRIARGTLASRRGSVQASWTLGLLGYERIVHASDLEATNALYVGDSAFDAGLVIDDVTLLAGGRADLALSPDGARYDLGVLASANWRPGRGIDAFARFEWWYAREQTRSFRSMRATLALRLTSWW